MRSGSADDGEHAAVAATPWWRRGWALVSGAILAAGALASAITAVVGLVRPAPDLVDRAEITFVDLVPFVPLSQYERRVGGGPRSLGDDPGVAVAAYVVPRTTIGPRPLDDLQPIEPPLLSPLPLPGIPTLPVPSLSGSPSSTGTSPSAEVPTSPAVTPSPVPPKLRSGLATEPPFVAPVDEFHYEDVLDEVAELAPRLELPPPPDGDDLPTVMSLTVEGVDDEGEPLPPDEAARRLVQVFGETRTTTTPEGRLDPLGVVVTANIRLDGLRGRELGVFWEVWSQDGGTQLYDRWLDQVPASRITARRESDAGTVRFWVPMPKNPGPYVIHVIVRDGDLTLHVRPSGPFT